MGKEKKRERKNREEENQWRSGQHLQYEFGSGKTREPEVPSEDPGVSDDISKLCLWEPYSELHSEIRMWRIFEKVFK